jgi:hypothetical protein
MSIKAKIRNRDCYTNRWKGNFESHRTRQIWKYCRLGLIQPIHGQ